MANYQLGMVENRDLNRIEYTNESNRIEPNIILNESSRAESYKRYSGDSDFFINYI